MLTFHGVEPLLAKMAEDVATAADLLGVTRPAPVRP
jgi:hypothetical protein